MTAVTQAGLGLTLAAGFMSGNCMLPSKFLRSWRWENMWAVFSLVSLVILPWVFALLFVNHLGAVYRSLHPSQFIAPLGFGICWGVAQILFGISVDRLGLSLAYAIIVGMGAALGTLVPLLATRRNDLDRTTVFLVLAGILLMAIGIALTAWSGRLRESMTTSTVSLREGGAYRTAILIAVVCGFLAPMLNYSFAFGQDIARQSLAFGNSPLRAGYAVWPIALAGGFLPNAGYSLYLLTRRRSWPAFQAPYPDLFWSSLMGILWMGAFSVYGMSAAILGDLGTSIGWGLFQIFMIMTASLSGVLTGEWRRASGKSKRLLAAGLTFLSVAMLLLATANRH